MAPATTTMTRMTPKASSTLRIERLDVSAKLKRDGIHAEGMLADAPHRHNSDARIRDEHLVGTQQIIEREYLLSRGDPQAVRLAQHDSAHYTGDTRAIHWRRHERPRFHDEHIAHGARHDVPARIEHQRLEGCAR